MKRNLLVLSLISIVSVLGISCGTADMQKSPRVDKREALNPELGVQVPEAPFRVVSPAAETPLNLDHAFGDHMVLQRDTHSPIWGSGPEGSKVEVTIGDQSYTTVVKNGRWDVKVGPFPAGGPYAIDVKSSGSNIQVKDILFGDVFLCGGQSNMSFSLIHADDGPVEVALALNDNLRLSSNKLRTQENQTNWAPTSPATVKDFSAVCYYFGKEIQRKYQIPVGLLNMSSGGTNIQTWMSKKTLLSMGLFNESTYQSSYKGSARLFESSILPMAPYRIKGVVWYQGESNVGNGGVNYYDLQKNLIVDWRSLWNDPQLPFIITQLPAFSFGGSLTGEQWARIRNDQLKIYQTIPNTFMAVTMDQGVQDDIHTPHKKIIGQRLAQGAKALIYKDNIAYQGPIVRSATQTNKTSVTLKFDFTRGQLQTRPLNHSVEGLEVCDDKLVCSPVLGVIEGDSTVVLDISKVKHARSIRYGWKNFPVPAINLYNKESFQASPFKIDIVAD